MSSALPQEETVEANAQTGIPPGRFQRTFSALRYRDFRLLWFGAFASTTGTFMQTLAQGWLVYTMTGSALLLGVDGFLATGPMLLFSLFGGVIADRMERRKIMMLSQILQGSFALILAALIYFHTIKIWHIFILSFLTGSAQSLSGPAYASLLPLLVKRDDMANAVAMNSMQFNLARVIGPALGGVVFGLWGATACFGINGLSFGFVIIALLMIKMPPVQPGATSTSMMAQMKEGFTFVASKRSLLLLTFLSFAGTFLGMPLFTMMPVVAKSIFNLGPQGLSLLQADYGIGSVVGALFVAGSSYAAKKGRLALALQLVFAATLIAFGISRHLAASLVPYPHSRFRASQASSRGWPFWPAVDEVAVQFSLRQHNGVAGGKEQGGGDFTAKADASDDDAAEAAARCLINDVSHRTAVSRRRAQDRGRPDRLQRRSGSDSHAGSNDDDRGHCIDSRGAAAPALRAWARTPPRHRAVSRAATERLR